VLEAEREQVETDLMGSRQAIPAAERALANIGRTLAALRGELASAQQAQEEHRRRPGLRAQLEAWAGVGETARLAKITAEVRRRWDEAHRAAQAYSAGRDQWKEVMDRLERRIAPLTQERQRAAVAVADAALEFQSLSDQVAAATRHCRESRNPLSESEALRAVAARSLDVATSSRDGATSRHQRAAEAHEVAHQERATAVTALAAARQHRVHLLAELAAAAKAATERQAALAERMKRARLEHESAAATLDGTETEPEALRQQINRLQAYIRLEERWAELLRLDPEAGSGAVELVTTAVIQASNVVCATVEGIAGRDVSRYADFQTLIVDEASRVTDSSFLVPAVRARRWILVGDERQLPPYVDQDTEYLVHTLLALDDHETNGTELPVAVDQIGRMWKEEAQQRTFRHASVLDLATRMQTDGSWTASYRPTLAGVVDRLSTRLQTAGVAEVDPRQELLQALSRRLVTSLFDRCVTDPQAAHLRRLLTVQRRMIEPIASLVSEPIYGGDYVSPSEQDLRAAGVTPLTCEPFPTPITFYNTHKHQHARESQVGSGFANDGEARFVAGLCRRWDAALAADPAHDGTVSVSILTFYKAQAGLIEKRIGGPGFQHLKLLVIDTVDKIQGQESDLVFISFVRRRAGRGRPGPLYGLWLQDLHRLNVAVTRARRGLIMVGHEPTLRSLNGVPQAEAFYRHLFTALETRPEMTLVKDFVL
jgi:hypothetical protein